MRFFLILTIIFFLLRYVLPVVLRWAVTAFVRKQMQDGGFSVPPQSQAASAPVAGQVRVEYVPPKSTINPDKPHSFRGGEYVDFEEVKE
jgi:hypothetical protein